jgi:formylglycine-generating enzyme required for sulfatase activity
MKVRTIWDGDVNRASAATAQRTAPTNRRGDGLISRVFGIIVLMSSIALSACVAKSPAAPTRSSRCPQGFMDVKRGKYRSSNPVQNATEVEVASGFCIQINRVTAGELLSCISENRCSVDANVRIDPVCDGSSAGRPWGRSGGPMSPVVCVTHGEAERYCASSGGHLPTEAQWEVSVGLGMSTSRYPWGDDDPPVDVGEWDGGPVPLRFSDELSVGIHQSFWYGAEWTSSEAARDQGAATVLRLDLGARWYWVRGGRGSWRSQNDDRVRDATGFRCVLEIIEG